MSLLGGLFKDKSKTSSTSDQSQRTTQAQQSQTGLADFLSPDVGRSLALQRQATLTPATLQGELVAGLDRNTIAGLNASRQGAGEIAPILAQQRQGLSDTLAGKYTDPASNPFFEGLSDFVRSQVTPAVDSRFGAAGVFGSPLHQIGLAQGISRELAPHLFSAYQQERGIQNDAINNAASIAGQNATARGNILQQIGDVFQGQHQNELDAEVYRQQYDTDQRRQSLSDYSSALAQIAQFFRKEKSSASSDIESKSKTKGKTTSAPGLGNSLIQIGGGIGSKLATGGAA